MINGQGDTRNVDEFVTAIVKTLFIYSDPQMTVIIWFLNIIMYIYLIKKYGQWEHFFVVFDLSQLNIDFEY